MIRALYQHLLQHLEKSLSVYCKSAPNFPPGMIDGDVRKKQERRQVQIDNPFDDEQESMQRRRTIYGLDSYRTSNISIRSKQDFEAGETSATELDKPREPRYSASMVERAIIGI